MFEEVWFYYVACGAVALTAVPFLQRATAARLPTLKLLYGIGVAAGFLAFVCFVGCGFVLGDQLSGGQTWWSIALGCASLFGPPILFVIGRDALRGFRAPKEAD